MHDLPISNEDYVEVAQFADDIAIWLCNRRDDTVTSKLQKASTKLIRYLKEWKLKLNPIKTEAIFFTRRTATSSLPYGTINVEGHDFPWSSSGKYLGIYLNKTNTFKNHIEIRALYPFINRKSKLHPHNKLF